jgi:predicted Zn-dependent protease
VTATGELPAALTGASYGRSQENEADQVGQELAARAGWNPASLALVMDALAREQEMVGQDPNETSWFATHPASPDRAVKIRDRAGGLTVGTSRAIAGTRATFLAELEGMVVGSSARHGVFDGSDFLHPGLGFVLSFPDDDGWKQINVEQAVAVVREDPAAAVVLQVVAEGDDALAVAQEFKPKKGKLDAPPRAETQNGLQTAYAIGRAGGGWGRQPVRASARWITHGGLVYRILSESTDEGYAFYADDFDETERSFRVLTSADHERIFENRLHIETAKDGETIVELLGRVGSDWGPEAAAAANGVSLEAKFGQGDPVKVTRRVRFSVND